MKAGAKERGDRLARRRMLSAARLAAVQALFQMEAAGSDLDTVRTEFETHRLASGAGDGTGMEADLDHFRQLLLGAITRQARIDQLTDQALVATWPLDRIDPTLRALFRAAGSELVTLPTPPRVTINEYVEIAKAFFPEGPEARLANGVLDHMAHAARPEAFTTPRTDRG